KYQPTIIQKAVESFVEVLNENDVTLTTLQEMVMMRKIFRVLSKEQRLAVHQKWTITTDEETPQARTTEIGVRTSNGPPSRIHNQSLTDDEKLAYYKMYTKNCISLHRPTPQNICNRESMVCSIQTIINPCAGLSWDRYGFAEDILAFNQALYRQYPHVELVKLGETYEGRPIQALIFTERATNYNEVMEELKTKPVIMIEGGLHAREWLSPAVTTYIANELAKSGPTFFKHAVWVVLPLLNPDGYQYSRIKNPIWRKNRKLNPGNPKCPGVDLNRNFDIEWNTTGSSNNPCNRLYHGLKAGSEEETKAVMSMISMSKNIKFYMSVHSFTQKIFHPWGALKTPPNNIKEIKNFANKFASYLLQFGGRKYEIEQPGVNIRTRAGGGSDDYAYSKGIPIVFTLELPDKMPVNRR
ncbi:unnamed protein product, partial [Meganyctiphanes norvegica]